ncbi:hypothetical protein KI387_037445, partial [Taxus chinensis]
MKIVRALKITSENIDTYGRENVSYLNLAKCGEDMDLKGIFESERNSIAYDEMVKLVALKFLPFT